MEQSVSIVVLGAFNPSIFLPGWFAKEDLVREKDAESAEIEIVHPEVTVFTLDWLRLEATRERLVVRSDRESHYEVARDLVCGALDLLRHTPAGKVGVNHDVVFECGSREAFDNFGWKLVPQGPWNQVLDRPGTARIDEQGRRTDDYDGYIRVRIEPILDGGTRVRVGVNDHFELSKENSSSSTECISALLQDEWATIAKRASEILSHMKGLVR
ncbi:MAG: hypothetical protein CME06_04265 [Gemmatimonadetes bacterium]|nr:hypothetical protein [Gemmatimonadota bacterium]